MRFLLVLLLTALLSANNVRADSGTFLILKRVYFYINANKSGKRLLTKTQQAYDVVDVIPLTKKSVMYQIIVPQEKNLINGSGFIVETEVDLRAMGKKPVKVYPKVLTIASDFSKYQPVPPIDLSFTGRQEKSPDFPNISWKAVNYKTSTPGIYWVPDWSGIYRPDKSAEWFNQTLQKAKQLKLEGALLRKVLLGMVEAGFTKKQVVLALGEPQKTKKLEKNNQEEWQYKGRKIVFNSDRVLRVL